jgi:hypothetical protein
MKTVIEILKEELAIEKSKCVKLQDEVDRYSGKFHRLNTDLMVKDGIINGLERTIEQIKYDNDIY